MEMHLYIRRRGYTELASMVWTANGDKYRNEMNGVLGHDYAALVNLYWAGDNLTNVEDARSILLHFACYLFVDFIVVQLYL